MRCHELEELLPLYASGELGEAELGRVREHLEKCPSCRSLRDSLTRAGEALAGWPEVEPSPALMARLRDISAARPKRGLFPSLSLKPSLQPVLAGAFMVLVFTATMVFTPAGGRLLKTLDRQLHAGYGALEKLYARAESLADSLGGAKDEVIVSIKTLPPLSGGRE